MRRMVTVIAVVAALLSTGSAVPASAAGHRVTAAGDFSTVVDFSTLTLTPRGANCVLEVEGTLTFTGTIEGVATAKTRALIFATCADVEVNLPGTFRDVFRSELDFTGSVDGSTATFDITWLGVTRVGGEINALMLLSNGRTGVLRVDAQVAVGGSYDGWVKH